MYLFFKFKWFFLSLFLKCIYNFYISIFPLQLEMMKDKPRPFMNKGEDILPFEKMKEQRMRERMARVDRVRRAVELRR